MIAPQGAKLMLTACRSYCFQKVVVLLTRVRFWAICLVVLELATRKTGSFIFYRFFPSWARNGFKFASGARDLFNIFFPWCLNNIFVFFLFFGTIQKIVSSFSSYNFGWCAVLVLEPSLYVEIWFLSIFWGDAFALKKTLFFGAMIFETAFLQVSGPLNKYRSFSFIYNRWNSPFPGLGDLLKISLGGPFPGLETF